MTTVEIEGSKKATISLAGSQEATISLAGSLYALRFDAGTVYLLHDTFYALKADDDDILIWESEIVTYFGIYQGANDLIELSPTDILKLQN